MQQTFDIEIRVLSCENCGAPVRAPGAGGMTTCEYCGTQMLIGQRRIDAVRVAHNLRGDARLAKLRMETGRALPDNPYSTVRPPPGCESLIRSGQLAVIQQLEIRFREALALVRADPSFEHQRLLWWCATMLNQGYGMHDKHLERRAVLERAIDTIEDPGFRHMLFVNLAGAAARFGEIAAARAWIEKCDPEPEDVMLDSGYRIGMASVLVREGDGRQTLALVGARANDVPEAFQYRMMFALYRIHAHELLGDLEAAMAAAMAIRGDPEVGAVLIAALRLNQLGPKTAAALESPGSGVARAPVVAADNPAPVAHSVPAAPVHATGASQAPVAAAHNPAPPVPAPAMGASRAPAVAADEVPLATSLEAFQSSRNAQMQQAGAKIIRIVSVVVGVIVALVIVFVTLVLT